MSRKPDRWTHHSVLAFAEGRDPVEIVTERSRAIVMEAMDSGWTGPPFEPLALAEFLRIDVVAREEVPDARTVASATGSPIIEYNPTRPRGRVRYSLAHEIAHTLFPDWAAEVRNRADRYELKGDDWQLEALCNIAAAEFVMPIGSFTSLAGTDLGIDPLLREQKRYDVSEEAILIRAVHLRSEPCAMFCASPIEKRASAGRYRIDYSIGSRGWKSDLALRGLLLPEHTVVAKCSAIGFTAKGRESWAAGEEPRIEAVGIPPYPGSRTPRVAGLLIPISGEHDSAPAPVEFIFGDATRPQGDGLKMIVHVVTDGATIWGGGGFAAAVRQVWPHAQEEFREWVNQKRNHLSLGRVHFSTALDDVQVVSMVAQHGYGPSSQPRIRYGALRQAMSEVAQVAKEAGATIHMPRIGTGLSGGSWDVVEELVWHTLVQAGLRITVYDLPGRRSASQESLFNMSARGQRGNP